MLNTEVKHAGPLVGYAFPHMETMGDRIKRLREAQGLTQQELGERCGVSKSAVSQWEDGTTADIKLIPFLKLQEVLKTDGHYLVFGPDRAPDPDPGSTGRFRRPNIGNKNR
jgi:transcriptional regulator with XRE-family HTH domain